VLIGFLGWLAMMRKPDMALWYKASTITKYVGNVRRRLERRCGFAFGDGVVPALVTLPQSLTGLISHRNEGTLPRLAVAPQPLLDMCENEGVVLTARPDQGPLVTFAHDYSLEDKLRKLCYLGACFDGLLLTMRSMEYLSKSKKFDRMEALSRADVVIGSNGTTGVMFIKRHKGDKKQQWPAKQFSPAFRGKLCALALRLVYERLNPVPWNIDPSTVPYWQLPDTLPLTRTNLQSFLQAHMTRMGAPAKLYKSHSLRKGGVTALLAAGVPLPQIQLMARWVSPNMTQLYASLTSHNLFGARVPVDRQAEPTGPGGERSEVLASVH
jgi:hypothetical protein